MSINGPDTLPENKRQLDGRCQEITNALAKAHSAKASLITELVGSSLIVKSASSNAGHSHRAGDRIDRGPNIFCFRVIDSKQALYVEKSAGQLAADSQQHKNIAYFGHPVFNPDGSLFGTICILEADSGGDSEKVRRSIEQFAHILERDLAAASGV